jgi:NAD-specific glutamate dehydrogenase
MAALLQAYYANVDAEDLAARDPKELAGAALSHLMFARQRRGPPLVRVFNPTLREHGYTSPHTVIEMVNDDMPFLVDSIGLALTQRALTLHFLAHPDLCRDARQRRGLCSRSRSAARAPRTKQPSGSSRFNTSKWIGSSIRGAAIAVFGDRAQHARRAGGLRRLGKDARRRHGRRPDDLNS